MNEPLNHESKHSVDRSTRFCTVAEMVAFVAILIIWVQLAANRLIFRYLPVAQLVEGPGSSNLPGLRFQWMSWPASLYVPEMMVLLVVILGAGFFLFGLRSKELGVRLIRGSGLPLIASGVAIAFLMLSVVAVGLHHVGAWETVDEHDFTIQLPPDDKAPIQASITFWPIALVLAAVALNVMHRGSRFVPAYELRHRIIGFVFPAAVLVALLAWGSLMLDYFFGKQDRIDYYGWGDGPHTLEYAGTRGYYSAIIWSMTVLVWVWTCRFALTATKSRFETRADYALCEKCGYDLRGTIQHEKPACPECGKKVDVVQASRIRAHVTASQ